MQLSVINLNLEGGENNKRGGGVFASPVHKACSCVPLSLKWPGRMSAERLLSKALCYEDAEPNNNSKTATTPLSSKMASASNVCAEGQLGVWWRCLVVWCKVQVMRRFLLSYCFPRSFPYRLVSGAKHYPATLEAPLPLLRCSTFPLLLGYHYCPWCWKCPPHLSSCLCWLLAFFQLFVTLSFVNLHKTFLTCLLVPSSVFGSLAVSEILILQSWFGDIFFSFSFFIGHMYVYFVFVSQWYTYSVLRMNTLKQPWFRHFSGRSNNDNDDTEC